MQMTVYRVLQKGLPLLSAEETGVVNSNGPKNSKSTLGKLETI